MDLYTKIQKQIKWIVEQIQCIKTGACINCEHPVTSVNGELGDVVIDGTEIELIEGGGVSVTQAFVDLDTNKANATDLANYLPLTGGTLTGDLNIDTNLKVTGDYYADGNGINRFISSQPGSEFAWRISGETEDAMVLGFNGNLTLKESFYLEGGFYQSNGFNNLTIISSSSNCNFLSSNKDFYFNKGIAIEKAVIGKNSVIPVSGVIDLSLSNHFSFTITQGTTFSFTNLPNMDMTFTLGITRGGTGTELYAINTSNVTVKTANIEINETVGSLTEWWCKYYSTTNTITINAITGFTTL